MSFFRRQESRPAADASETAGPTHIAAGTLVQGVVSGLTELVIDGRVEGEVRVEAGVAIGPDGEVIGPVHGRTVRIGGRVVGRVEAEERVELLPAASLEGDVAAPRIVIAEGAFFKGMAEMHTQARDQDADQSERGGG